MILFIGVIMIALFLGAFMLVAAVAILKGVFRLITWPFRAITRAAHNRRPNRRECALCHSQAITTYDGDRLCEVHWAYVTTHMRPSLKKPTD